MKKTILFGIILSSATALSLYSCGGDDNGASDAGQADHTSSSSGGSSGSSSGSGSSGSGSGSSSGSDTGVDAGPPPPALGTQIDRMGRPAINTALIRAFDANAVTRNVKKDAYNADSQRSSWPATWKAEIARSLAVFDAIDGTCGNQQSYNFGYDNLANELADDALWVNTGSATCVTYFAVELNMLGDCGGRTLRENPLDTTYNLLISGQVTGISNGVTQPASQPDNAFPYLAAPY